MPISSPSPLADVADRLIREKQGQSLEEWLADKRDHRVPFREIADDLATVTDQLVVVSHEAIRRWVRHYAPEPTAVTS